MVAQRVVDLLEPVEIDQRYPERRKIELGPRRAFGDREVPCAPRAEPGELVGRGDDGELLGLLEQCLLALLALLMSSIWEMK